MARKDSVLRVELGIDATNEDIVEQMRIVKRCREEKTYGHVVCAIRGFDSDPRGLPEIPEVRAFCRRLLTLGFISYLDFSTQLDPSEETKLFWGAAEVWFCAEGKGLKLLVDAKLLDAIEHAVLDANDKADRLLGPMADG